MSRPENIFPFDGTCEGSRGSDLELVFINGRPLKAHSQFLAMVSPVLRTAVEECTGRNQMLLGNDSRRGWHLMLNFLHPLKSVHSSSFIKPDNLDDMGALARLAHKYSVEHLQAYLDKILTQYVRNGGLTGDGRAASQADKFFGALTNFVVDLGSALLYGEEDQSNRNQSRTSPYRQSSSVRSRTATQDQAQLRRMSSSPGTRRAPTGSNMAPAPSRPSVSERDSRIHDFLVANSSRIEAYLILGAKYELNGVFDAIIAKIKDLIRSTRSNATEGAQGRNNLRYITTISMPQIANLTSRIIKRLSDEGFDKAGCKMASEILALLI